MSSLRISHQNRGIGASSAGSDTGRSEHADEGASFASALGAAGVVTKNAGALLGGKPGDGGDFSAGPRKRAETPAKPSDPASIAAVAAGAVVVGTVVAPPTTAQPAAGGESSDVPAIPDSSGIAAISGGNGIGVTGDSHETATVSGSNGIAVTAGSHETTVGAHGPGTFDAPAALRAAPDAQTDAIRNVASKIAVLDGQSVALAAPTGAVTGTLVAMSPMPLPPGATGAVTAPAESISPAVAPSGSVTNAPQTLPRQADEMPADAGAVVTAPGVSISHIAAMFQMPAAPGLPAVEATNGTPGLAMSGTPSAVTIGAADASGPAVPLAPALPAGSGQAAEGATGIPDMANVVITSWTLPSLGADQPVTADGGGGLGFTARDRSVPSALAPDSSSVASASANAPTDNAFIPVASTTAMAPGAASEASSADTIADQVSGQLARMVSNGSHEMVMRLHPPELGDLTVRIAVSGRDVAAWFASPQLQVQSAISAAMGQLQTNLSNAGYNFSGAWVGADTSSARQQNSSAPPSPAPSAQLGGAVIALPATAASTRSLSSGLNIYV